MLLGSRCTAKENVEYKEVLITECLEIATAGPPGLATIEAKRKMVIDAPDVKMSELSAP